MGTIYSTVNIHRKHHPKSLCLFLNERRTLLVLYLVEMFVCGFLLFVMKICAFFEVCVCAICVS